MGNVTIGTGSRVILEAGTSGGLFSDPRDPGVLTQVAGPAVQYFSNAGSVEVKEGGTLNIRGSAISGGGVIRMQGGVFNADGTIGLDLRGQAIAGTGTISIRNALELDARSSLGASAGLLTVMVTDDRTSNNRGELFAENGELRIVGVGNDAHTIRSGSGRMSARNGGLITLDHATRVQLRGGVYETDANSEIRVKQTAWLQSDTSISPSQTPRLAGNMTFEKNLLLLSDVAVEGRLELLSDVTVIGDNELSGNGETRLTGGTVQLTRFNNSNANSALLRIGNGHTLTGSGRILGSNTLTDQLINRGTLVTTGDMDISIDTFVNIGTLQSNAGRTTVRQDFDNRAGSVIASGGDILFADGSDFVLGDSRAVPADSGRPKMAVFLC